MLVAIHDVGPRFEAEVDRIRDFLAAQIDTNRLALLVVPNHWGEAPLRAGSPFAARLRRWAEQGNEIFLHGWFHRDQTDHRSFTERLKARFLTAGEAEFLGLARPSASSLMHAGSSLLEDITGTRISGFIAPAWLYGPGARQAMAELDFPIAEDHFTVWNPRSGDVLSRGAVVSWASRTKPRMLSSLAFARASRRLLRDHPQVRIAVHPADLDAAPLRRSIAETIRHFGRTHRPGRYVDLLARRPIGGASANG